MSKSHYKKIALVLIKVIPAIMALTCSTKIFLLGIDKDTYFTTNRLVNSINLTTDIIIIILVYSLGRCFNFCWKHRSLCRTALIGYLNYGLFLIFNTPSQLFLPLTTCYTILVIIMILIYYGTN